MRGKTYAMRLQDTIYHLHDHHTLINRNLWHEVTASLSLSILVALYANFMVHLLYFLPFRPPSTYHLSIRNPFVYFMTQPSSCYCCCCPLLLKSRRWKTTISYSVHDDDADDDYDMCYCYTDMHVHKAK